MMRSHGLPVLTTFTYGVPPVERGYAGRTLYVNVADGDIRAKPVSGMMKERFIGGRGFDLWLLWQAVSPETRWYDPENEIVIASGPCGGITQYPGSGKSIVTTISPLTDIAIDSNVGGHVGPYLKFAGWDALEVQGNAEQECIIWIDASAGPSGEAHVQILAAPGDCPTDTHPLGQWITERFTETDRDRELMAFASAG
jgi:aldehyde:ferredoxin oxidoreductase